MEVNYTVISVSQIDENSLITKVNYVINGVEINDIDVIHYNPINNNQIKENIIARGLSEQTKKIVKTVMDEVVANPLLISQ